MQKLTSHQRKILEKSPHVEGTTESHVIYGAEFKLKAIKLSIEGMSPKEIFYSHGLDFDFFNEYYFSANLKRWRKIYEQYGEDGFKQERRGRALGGGRPKKTLDNLSMNDLKVIIEIQKGVIEELKKRKALAKK